MDVIPNSLALFWAFFGVILHLPAVYVGVKYAGKRKTRRKRGNTPWNSSSASSAFSSFCFIVGVAVSKRIKTEEDWFVAGRNLGIIRLSARTSHHSEHRFRRRISRLLLQDGMGGWWNWAGTARHLADRSHVVSRNGFAGSARYTLPDFLEARYGRAHIKSSAE
jgi:hypothetical protein